MTPANRVHTVSIKASDSCPSSAVLARKWRAGAEVDAGATNILLDYYELVLLRDTKSCLVQDLVQVLEYPFQDNTQTSKTFVRLLQVPVLRQYYCSLGLREETQD